MSSTLAVDVILRPRLGPYYSARRQRVTSGSTQAVYFDVVNALTGDLFPDPTGTSALVWLPGTAGTDAPGQPLEVTEYAPGTLRVDVPADLPGAWRVWLQITGPSVETAEIVFDVPDDGGLPVLLTLEEWRSVQAAGAAAGASAGAVAGQGAGVAAVLPLAQAAQAAASTAADAADAAGQSLIAAGDAAAAAYTQAVDAAGFAVDASTAAASALAGSNLYASVAAGLAATAEGLTFNVAASGEAFATTYRKVSGAAQQVGIIPSKAAIDAVPAKSGAIGVVGGRTTTYVDIDSARNVLMRYGPDHFGVAGLWIDGLSDGSWTFGGPAGPLITVSPAGEPSFKGLPIRVSDVPGADLAIYSATGEFQAAAFNERGNLQLLGYPDDAGGVSYGDFTAEEIAGHQAAAEAYSSRAMRKDVSALPFITDQDMVLVLAVGQSFGEGWEGWPALTKDGLPPGLMMVGQSVHPAYENANSWTPVGGSSALSPVVANVLRTGEPRIPLTDAEVAALAFGANNIGEGPTIAAAAHLRRRWDAARGKPAGDASVQWLVMTAGSGGKTASELLNLYFGRVQGAIDIAYAAATAAGKNLLVLVDYNQGENDYTDGTTYNQYLVDMPALMAAVRGYVATKTGGSRLVPFFVKQTGGQYAIDAQQLAIARAQIEIERTAPGVFIVMNNQNVPDKNDHLTSNGYRWIGEQTGKVMAMALVDRRPFHCPRVISWHTKGTTLLARCHAMQGPVRFGVPYVGRTPSPYAAAGDRGLYAEDGGGQMTVAGASVVAPQVLIWEMGREVSGALSVWLGRKAGTNGAICLCDSDATRLQTAYAYTAGSGQTADENISELVGLTYDPSNFLLADVQTATPV